MHTLTYTYTYLHIRTSTYLHIRTQSYVGVIGKKSQEPSGLRPLLNLLFFPVVAILAHPYVCGIAAPRRNQKKTKKRNSLNQLKEKKERATAAKRLHDITS